MLAPVIGDDRLGRRDDLEALRALLARRYEQVADLHEQIGRIERSAWPSRIPARDVVYSVGSTAAGAGRA